jgi:SAM-dependent methyltransferase
VSSAFPDDPDLTARRASSFGAHAAAYAEERPGYPVAAIRWCLEPVAGRSSLRVLDLAAGTGKLTEALVAEGVGEVVAVEPDPGMLAELRRRVPGVRSMTGTAEHIPLPDGSVDAVLAGQAMHWFDFDRAFPEIWRVLAAGGVLGGLWNDDDVRVPWVAGFKEACRSDASFANGWLPTDLVPSPQFPSWELTEFSHAQRRTAESLTATTGTHSHILVLDEAERIQALDRVLDYLRSRPETAEGEFDLPLVTTVVRGVRGTGS